MCITVIEYNCFVSCGNSNYGTLLKQQLLSLLKCQTSAVFLITLKLANLFLDSKLPKPYKSQQKSRRLL